jgi:hypothetical protein
MGFDPKRDAFLTLSRKLLLWHMNYKKVPNGHTAPVTACVYNPTFELVSSFTAFKITPATPMPMPMPLPICCWCVGQSKAPVDRKVSDKLLSFEHR